MSAASNQDIEKNAKQIGYAATKNEKNCNGSDNESDNGKKKSLSRRFKKAFAAVQGFTENFTVHGLPQVFNGKPWEKVVWGISLVIGRFTSCIISNLCSSVNYLIQFSLSNYTFTYYKPSLI